MQDFFMANGFFIVVVGIPVVFGCAAGMVSAVAKNWRKARVAEIEAALKQEMIQKGMSAEEIIKVIQVSRISVTEDDERHSRPKAGCVAS